MREAGLYRAILSLIPPWTRADLVLDVRGQQVTVRVDAGDGPLSCPECHTPVPGYDLTPRRRHLDPYQKESALQTFKAIQVGPLFFNFSSDCVTRVTDTGRVF
jgi:hypothetical protein